jgi:cell division protein FtsB
LPLVILSMAIIAVPWMILSPQGLDRLTHLRQERDRAHQEISRLSQEIRQLRVDVEKIKNEPDAVEAVARDELGLVRQTDIVFQFKE